MTDTLTVEIKKVAEGGNPTAALGLLHEMDRNDITAKAAIRYLFNVGKWSLEEGSKFAEVLEHHFAKHDDMVVMEPQAYQTVTGEIIKARWNHEIVIAAPPPRPVVEKPAKKPRSYKKNEDITLAKEHSERESGSRTFKRLSDVDTSGASDRLKRVIDIQRNS